MDNFLEEVKRFFDTATEEQLRKVRERALSFSNVGPEVGEYLNAVARYKEKLQGVRQIKTNNNESPEYSLDFLFA